MFIARKFKRIIRLPAARRRSLDDLVDSDKVATLVGAEILTNKTLPSPIMTGPIMSVPQIQDISADHQYVTAVSELAADRTVTLPLLIGNDEYVFKDHIVTFAGKTFDLGANTLTGTKAEFDVALSDGSFATSGGTTGGSSSAGAGNQYIEIEVGGTVFKVLHDGTV